MDLDEELGFFFDYDVAPEEDFYAKLLYTDTLQTTFAGQLDCPMPKYNSCSFGFLFSFPAASHPGLALRDHHAAVCSHLGLVLRDHHAEVASHQGFAFGDHHATEASHQGPAWNDLHDALASTVFTDLRGFHDVGYHQCPASCCQFGVRTYQHGFGLCDYRAAVASYHGSALCDHHAAAACHQDLGRSAFHATDDADRACEIRSHGNVTFTLLLHFYMGLA